MKRTAVVIFNLGGPESLETVYPFLRNLFLDPMIIRAPKVVRFFLSRFIAWRRAPVAKEIYKKIGCKSPILDETNKQAAALEKQLGDGYSVFVAMRYWKPFADAIIETIVNTKPDHIVLLPLYPQFSTTTTGSFYKVWKDIAKKAELKIPTTLICCWPNAEGFVVSISKEIDKAVEELPNETPYRILYSAHGLPEKIIAAGDPYAHQVECTAEAVQKKLREPSADHVICYQSRVGPMKWLTPYTENEIKRAGKERLAVIIVPIAFVSEHSETLVELDIEYANLAKSYGVPYFKRVKTVRTDKSFIRSLASQVSAAENGSVYCESNICRERFRDCPHGRIAENHDG